MPERVEPVRHAGVAMCDDGAEDAVVVDHRLVAVQTRLVMRLVAGVVVHAGEVGCGLLHPGQRRVGVGDARVDPVGLRLGRRGGPLRPVPMGLRLAWGRASARPSRKGGSPKMPRPVDALAMSSMAVTSNGGVRCMRSACCDA
jgi:hypothetical protein